MTRLTDGWINRPSIDYLLTAVIATTLVLVNPTNLLVRDQHGTWYQTLASVTGVLLSLSAVVITLVLTVTPNDRLQRVYENVGPNLGRLVLSSIGGLAIATGGFASLFLSETGPHRLRVGITASLVSFTAMRFARLWWIFRRIIEALTTPAATSVNSRPVPWQPPVVEPHHYALRRRRPKRVD